MQSIKKDASSQAAWALLTEGVSAARLELHRLQHLVNRALELVQASEQREQFHRMAGDIIVAIPKRLEQAQTHLDRTSYALSKLGEDFLASRLSISDKTIVEEAVDPAGNGPMRATLSERVAARWLAKQD